MARKTDVSPLAERKPPHERPCDYCGGHSHGVVNGIAACGDHFLDALDGHRPHAEPRMMLGVVPKPVAGRD